VIQLRQNIRRELLQWRTHGHVWSRKALGASLMLVGVATGMVSLATWTNLADRPALTLQTHAPSTLLLDRHGIPLSHTLEAGWNVQGRVPLYRIPDLLRQSVLRAEDKRFYEHHGVDWYARAHALWQNLNAGRNLRGASTISEQVVRMLVPRPRTLWSKWLEGFDAQRLEKNYTKADILEFYLNQVPYAANRRGVASAARYYFDRDLDTLDGREMVALAILPRAPSGLDPFRGSGRALAKRSIHLASQLREEGILSGSDWQHLIETPLEVSHAQRRGSIGHFRTYVEHQLGADAVRQGALPRLRTTLDSGLLDFTQKLLDTRLSMLASRRVNNGAALIVDRRSGEILAWAVAGADPSAPVPGRFVDAVLVPRQPGSALKPFLYAAAIDAGWSPGTMLEDAPLSEAVGTGLHRFNNYSRQFYGEVSLRQALGNSLNIPAIHAVNFVGPEHYLDILRGLGFESLTKPASFYGDGLALGNGEVSLLELVRGYLALANGGVAVPLKARLDDMGGARSHAPPTRILSADATSLIGNILSDPWARVMEFGRYSTLNLPVQTAVKTGTSTDYRDAWAVGYDSRYVIGVWVGNLDQSPTDGITGSTGPALVLRGLFAYLNRDQNTARLAMSTDLDLRNNCDFTEGTCAQIFDYRTKSASVAFEKTYKGPAILSPTSNLRLAYDPRLPASAQMFRFQLGGIGAADKVTWIVNGEPVAEEVGPDLMWQVRQGTYAVQAIVQSEYGTEKLGPVAFSVR